MLTVAAFLPSEATSPIPLSSLQAAADEVCRRVSLLYNLENMGIATGFPDDISRRCMKFQEAGDQFIPRHPEFRGGGHLACKPVFVVLTGA